MIRFSKFQLLVPLTLPWIWLFTGGGCVSSPNPVADHWQEDAGLPVQIAPESLARAEALAYFSLGLSREMHQDLPGALEAYLTAIQKDPENETLHIVATQRLVRNQQTEEAKNLLRALLERDGDNVNGLRWLAMLHLKDQEKEEAGRLLDRAVALHSPLEMVYLQAIQLHLQAGRQEEALRIARLGAEHADHPERCLGILASLLMRQLNSVEDLQEIVDLNAETTAVLDRAIAAYPPAEAFLFLKAQHAFRRRVPEEAFTAYQLLDEHFEGSAEIRGKMLLHLLRNHGEGNQSLRRVRHELEKRNEDGLALYLQGLLYELSRQPELALPSYERAGTLLPEDVGTQLKIALLSFQIGRNQRALNLLERLVESHPDHPEVLLRAGEIFLALGKYPESADLLGQRNRMARRGHPLENAPRVQAQLAMALLAADGTLQAAEDAAAEAAAERGMLEWIWAHQLQRVMDLRDTQPEKSKAHLQALLHLLLDLSDRLTRNPEVEILLGKTYSFDQNFTGAVDAFERARALAEDLPDAAAWLNADFYFDMGAAKERAGLIEEAEKTFQRAIALDPAHHRALNYLAYMWAERKVNLDEALALVRRALEVEPANGAYLDTLGWIYYQQGNYEQARVEITKAAELEPDESVIVEHLGDALMQLKRPVEARGLYRIALELGSEGRESIVRDSLRRAEDAVGDSLKHQSEAAKASQIQTRVSP